jgi:hypothetical protein
MKAYGGNKVIAPAILNFATRWRRLSAATRFIIYINLRRQLMHRPAIYEKKLSGDIQL